MRVYKGIHAEGAAVRRAWCGVGLDAIIRRVGIISHSTDVATAAAA